MRAQFGETGGLKLMQSRVALVWSFAAAFAPAARRDSHFGAESEAAAVPPPSSAWGVRRCGPGCGETVWTWLRGAALLAGCAAAVAAVAFGGAPAPGKRASELARKDGEGTADAVHDLTPVRPFRHVPPT